METKISFTPLKDDELMHWKYIKKVRGRNGKMRYVYQDSGKLDQAKKLVTNAESEVKKAREATELAAKNGNGFITAVKSELEAKKRLRRAKEVVKRYERRALTVDILNKFCN